MSVTVVLPVRSCPRLRLISVARSLGFTRLCLTTLGCTGLGFAEISFSDVCCKAPVEEPFYHQLIDVRERPGYQPTRSFTIVTDAENGNRLVAEDDPDLRFNLMWMDQYQPGYRTRNGGAAIGQVLRNYAKSLYKSYRANKASANSALPDSEGTGSVGDLTNTEYDLRLKEDEVKIGVKYTY